jgi:hypothetical protein
VYVQGPTFSSFWSKRRAPPETVRKQEIPEKKKEYGAMSETLRVVENKTENLTVSTFLPKNSIFPIRRQSFIPLRSDFHPIASYSP